MMIHSKWNRKLLLRKCRWGNRRQCDCKNLCGVWKRLRGESGRIREKYGGSDINLYLLGWKYRDSRKCFWQKSVHIHTCCCIAVQDPLYLSPLTTCNRNVETLVQRHSCLRSLTSWAKCLRNAPCQCTAHATARVDIRLFKSENFPSCQNSFSQQTRNSNKK